MQIIPVIDLKEGLAVHAREGHREHYRPLVSRLCSSPEPCEVLRGLLELYSFSTIYLADLDALGGKPAQERLIDALGRHFAGVGFWVDQGLPLRPPDTFAQGYFSLIAGSESLEYDNLSMLPEAGNQLILSLDFMNGVFMGPEALLTHPAWWPKRVILMNLSHVGSQKGPDFERMADLMARHPGHDFIAAGGVRHEADLHRLAAMGFSAVLMASALHDGRVDRAVIERMMVDSADHIK
ncbi:nickel transporter [Candidatus Woesearchaeota archaeon]|jgi:phosphoribosylformimino-5-aminoimidazole carboxamide ribotide isomerase|nr:nickel transporter [Candidatus Woesearchaeota archaeon]